ncbi:uncharacterized protein LOC130714095 [Lotus japonicus]|uniref:uncharacterized protein LOC130714095 n=1 Tax=Lotus japonicus TaxID=34305 RepID=UPI002587A66C|nr:uncharacterized protein LOC130714095 [Lotus japonicus]
MGRFHVMQNYLAIFLALVACNYLPLTHGRQIKSLNHPSPLSTGTVAVNINVPTPSSERRKIESPMKPNYDVASFGDSGAGDTHAFRPTTPGNSPGVGHKKFAQDQEDNSMKAMVGVQSTDGFKPTNPGHSPGVGHGYQTKIGHLN